MFILEIDNFKNINDSRGHAKGDAVLKRVGHHLKETYGDYHVWAELVEMNLLYLLKTFSWNKK